MSDAMAKASASKTTGDGATQQVDVAVVGAGFAGLYLLHRLRKAGFTTIAVDEADDVGGTWYWNRYPGARCDIQTIDYSYTFDPELERAWQWSEKYATQPEILRYLGFVADRYDLRRDIRFGSKVTNATWDAAAGRWRLATDNGAAISCRAYIMATGCLSAPKPPEIEGVKDFKGEIYFTGRWPHHEVKLAGKRVAVIGTGASAFQFVPEIAGKVAHLTVFQRTPPWAFPTPHYHEQVPEGMKWLLETVPTYDKWYRFFLFWMATDGFLDGVRADPDWKGPTTAVSEANSQFREMIAFAIAAQIGEGSRDLLDKVIPQYPLGGKRALLDNGVWLQALQRDNVDLVTDPIAEITDTGLVTKDGVHHDVDVIIYGTGFYASRFLYPMSFVGKGGVTLEQKWDGDPRAYLGMTTPGFPNLFMIYGPNTNIVVNGSIIFFSECSVRYITGCLKLLADKDAATIECRQDVHDAFNIRVDDGNKLMAWGSPVVSSWYKNEKGRVTQNWPFALVDYWNATIEPNPDDFVIERKKVEAV